MAISIDRVYQKVLALANKEQRGYITPQEFNLFADHAQQDIFNQYFYDLEQSSRGNASSLDYADKVTNIESKISLFEKYDEDVSFGTYGDVELGGVNIYRLGMVRVGYGQKPQREAEQIQLKELNTYLNSPLTSSGSLAGPYYTKYYSQNNTLRIKVYPYPANQDTVKISYIENIIAPKWTYNIVGTNALYNPADPNFRNFQLHSSEESLLTIKILQLAGVSIKDYQLTQAAVQEEMKAKQEKQ